jgi:hypothetical protein
MRKHLTFAFFALAVLLTIAWAQASVVAPKQEQQLFQAQKAEQAPPALDANLPFQALRPVY